MYNDLKATPGDQPTIGIILCAEKDETMRIEGIRVIQKIKA